MEVLLDQNLGHRLRRPLGEHEVEWRIIGTHLHRVVEAVESAAPDWFQLVDWGTFNRKKILS